MAVIGDVLLGLAETLVGRGARLVHAYDPDAGRVAEAVARSAQGMGGGRGQVTHAVFAEDLGIRDGAFDLVVLADLASFSDRRDVLRRVRKMTAPTGVAVVAAANGDAKQALLSGGSAGKGSVGYYELFDLLSLQFAVVKMVGQAPFVGYQITDFSPEIEPSVAFDASLMAATEEPEVFLGIASERRVSIEPFLVVEIPARQVLEAARSAVEAPVAPSGRRAGEDAAGDARTQIAEAQTRIVLMTAELEDLRTAKANLQRDLDAAGAQIAEARAQVEEASARATKAREVEARMGDEHVRAERLTHAVRDLEEELARQRDRNQRLAKQLDDEKRVRQKAEIELGMVRGLAQPPMDEADRRAAEEALRSAEARADGLARELLAKSKETAELRREHESAEERAIELEKRIATKDARATDLEKQIAAKDARIADLEKQVAAKGALAADLERQLDAKDAQAADLERQLDAKDAQAADLERKIAAKDAQAADLERKIAAKDAHAADLERKIAAKDAQIDARDRRIADLEAQIDAKAAHAADHERKIADLQARLRDLEEEHAVTLRKIPAVPSADPDREAREAELLARARTLEAALAESNQAARSLGEKLAQAAVHAADATTERARVAERLAAVETALETERAARQEIVAGKAAAESEILSLKRKLDAAIAESESASTPDIQSLEAALRDRGHRIVALERELRESERIGRELLAELVVARSGAGTPTAGTPSATAPNAGGAPTPNAAPATGARAASAMDGVSADAFQHRIDALAADAAAKQAELLTMTWRVQKLERELADAIAAGAEPSAEQRRLEDALVRAQTEIAALRRGANAS